MIVVPREPKTYTLSLSEVRKVNDVKVHFEDQDQKDENDVDCEDQSVAIDELTITKKKRGRKVGRGRKKRSYSTRK